MTTIQIVLAILVSIFGLLVLLASSLAIFRASYLKEQVALLRNDRDDLVKSRDELRGKVAVLEKDLEAEKRKVEVLEQITIGKDLLESIQRSINEHDSRADKHLRAIHDTLEEVVDLLRDGERGERNHDDATS